MTSLEAYLKMEKILETYYFETKEYYDDLGSMMSEISTEIHAGKDGEIQSGDLIILEEDWPDAWDKIIGKGKEAKSNKEAFKVMKVILDYYVKEVEYDLGDAENYLKEKLGIK